MHWDGPACLLGPAPACDSQPVMLQWGWLLWRVSNFVPVSHIERAIVNNPQALGWNSLISSC